MIQKAIQIKLEEGLEARPVAMLVQVASQFESTVYINSEDRKVNAKSIMGMMSLGLASGEEVTVVADGNDEDTAVVEIEKFLSGKRDFCRKKSLFLRFFNFVVIEIYRSLY